ncbi:TetR-like C-terminal domain-containing protein [Streptomyces sp. NPDC005803]|uniref:TetR-like C-terminal domain-containing protein n=1 Tax=Streptomyces sp. NPDC005803 TaxID=3154297 RepID=UPI00340322EB
MRARSSEGFRTTPMSAVWRAQSSGGRSRPAGQPVFARAAARGELPVDVDPKLLLDLIAGAVWMRALLRSEPVPPGFAAAAVDAVLPARGGS